MDSKQGFIDAVKQGRLETVKSILENSPELAGARDENGVSAVLLAAYHGHKEISDYLLSMGVQLDFFEAATLGQKDAVQRSLEKDPSLATAYSSDGFTALGFACFFGHLEIMQLLLKAGADANAASRNKMRVAPLHSAVAHRDGPKALEMTKLLLTHNLEVNIAQEGGWTPLHQAAAHGQTEILRLLLRRGANPDARSSDGKRPADMSAEKGHQECVEILQSAKDEAL